jgi:hypothetical protein
MFIKCVNTPKRVVNGAIATITSIIYDAWNNVTTIEAKLINNSTKMILQKRSFQQKYTYDGYYY